MDTLTPISKFDRWWAKREDLACDSGLKMPSGSKVRQFLKMAEKFANNVPMIVGCSAHSAMQIYVAAAAETTGRQGIVYVPKRKELTKATLWAMEHKAEVNFVTPGYPSVYRKQARDRAKREGGCIKWEFNTAIEDTAWQTENLPKKVKRVIVPTGSGLTAAGVIRGLAERKRTDIVVVIVAVSPLSNIEKIMEIAKTATTTTLPETIYIKPSCKYELPTVAKLPDGTILDPYYAAKALTYIQDYDCLWVPGRRAVQ